MCVLDGSCEVALVMLHPAMPPPPLHLPRFATVAREGGPRVGGDRSDRVARKPEGSRRVDARWARAYGSSCLDGSQQRGRTDRGEAIDALPRRSAK